MFRGYRTVIFAFVLYGCESWLLALREEHKLQCLKIESLRKYLDLKRMRTIYSITRYFLASKSPSIVQIVKSRRLCMNGRICD
jgi:hypothetical protein